jgi:hypothetical protein
MTWKKTRFMAFAFQLCLEYGIICDRDPEGLKLNGTQQLMACGGDINIAGENLDTIKSTRFIGC